MHADFAPQIKVTPPGPKARKILEKDKQYITPAYTRGYPFVIERGEGSFAWDPDGNRFLDFTAGVAVNALGHAHPEIVKVIREQAGKFLHMAGTDFYYEVMSDFAEKLCNISPWKGNAQCFLTNSGTEGTEAAIKLARYVTKRPRMIAFYNGFHGRSMGSLSLTASKVIQRRHFSPGLGDVTHSVYNDLDFLEKYVLGKVAPPEDVAGIFLECVQGEGGYNIATKEFMQGLRRICDKHGILLCIDEVQTGLARTGKWWCIEHYGVMPDIIWTAKPIGGGLPLGAMIARRDLHVWPSGAHANTFGGNPLACAAGLKTIEILEKDGLRNVTAMGDYLSRKLKELTDRHPIVKEERGYGLLRAIEIVTASGQPDHDGRDALVDACFAKGLLLLGCGFNAIRLLPPLNVEKGFIDAAVEILDGVLAGASKGGKGTGKRTRRAPVA